MDNRLKRLRYRSWHRGCKETDIILGNFADDRLETLDSGLLAVYERLLDEDDVNIWDWISGKTAPSEDYKPLIEMFKAYGLPTE